MTDPWVDQTPEQAALFLAKVASAARTKTAFEWGDVGKTLGGWRDQVAASPAWDRASAEIGKFKAAPGKYVGAMDPSLVGALGGAAVGGVGGGLLGATSKRKKSPWSTALTGALSGGLAGLGGGLAYKNLQGDHPATNGISPDTVAAQNASLAKQYKDKSIVGKLVEHLPGGTAPADASLAGLAGEAAGKATGIKPPAVDATLDENVRRNYALAGTGVGVTHGVLGAQGDKYRATMEDARRGYDAIQKGDLKNPNFTAQKSESPYGTKPVFIDQLRDSRYMAEHGHDIFQDSHGFHREHLPRNASDVLENAIEQAKNNAGSRTGKFVNNAADVARDLGGTGALAPNVATQNKLELTGNRLHNNAINNVNDLVDVARGSKLVPAQMLPGVIPNVPPRQVGAPLARERLTSRFRIGDSGASGGRALEEMARATYPNSDRLLNPEIRDMIEGGRRLRTPGKVFGPKSVAAGKFVGRAAPWTVASHTLFPWLHNHAADFIGGTKDHVATAGEPVVPSTRPTTPARPAPAKSIPGQFWQGFTGQE